MNYDPLFLGAVFGTLAAVGLVRHKAPRATAILAALAVLCLLAGVPSMLAALGHPIARGPILLGIIIGAVGFAAFFHFDIIRGEHKTPLGLKAIGGKGGEGGGKANHHVRPLVVTVGLTVFGLLIAMNWSAVVSGTGGGFTQTPAIIAHSGA